MVKKKPKSRQRLNLYSNLANKRRVKKDAAAKKRAEYLATLPIHPVKRFFYRLHPKRVFSFWFSKRGFFLGLKIFGVFLLLMVITVGGVFAYFRKDLDQIRPEEIAKRVQTTVSRYYDRNDNLLWEDKGSGDYKLVIKSEEISEKMKQATVAIEDRDFYKHHGVSVSGTARALINNTSGKSVQGGSTLTQQLVKQVFFADQAGERGLGGIPRKIKEAILAIEVERMYDKDQILTLYLNESPYGGRRNGVESAAQTYFGKSAKELNLTESSLLAAIPQNPSVYNPYNIAGHEGLVARQHYVLDAMVRSGYISQKESDEAKKVAILDKIKPEVDQFTGMKAPHFIQMVRSELKDKLGEATAGKGGLIVKTTLDIRIQDKLEKEIKSFFKSGTPQMYNISNAASTIEDTQTGQIIAMVGSRDFRYPGFGQDNAATAYIQPGSTIKPFVYATLMQDKGADQQNFGSGTILSDVNIDSIYGAKLLNWDNRFMGNITIRQGLALSRNVPAVKAMYISGVDNTLKKIHEMGAPSYCKQEMAAGVGLSSAIGGCGVKQTELTNAYATLGRMGVYRPSSSILEIKNDSGETIEKWKKTSKQVLNPQIAYIISDILSDPSARTSLHGAYPPGLVVNGVRTAGKTGTSDTDSRPKDLWIANYSPALTMTIWLGNPDTSPIATANSVLAGTIVNNTLEYAHKSIYQKEKKWQEGDWFKRPDGIKQQGRELYPSWWKANQGQGRDKKTFDKVSKKLATKCTPEAAKITIEVIRTLDPITKKDTFIAPDGYDATKDDDVHKCGASAPIVSGVSYDPDSGIVSFDTTPASSSITSVEVHVNGKLINTLSGSASSANVGTLPKKSKITIKAIDKNYYSGSSTITTTDDS